MLATNSIDQINDYRIDFWKSNNKFVREKLFQEYSNFDFKKKLSKTNMLIMVQKKNLKNLTLKLFDFHLP